MSLTSDSGTQPTVSVAQLSLEGMHCEACSTLIEEVLGDEKGVARATVDLDTARATVEYDPSQLDLEQIQAAIAEAGYSSTSLS